MPSFGEERAYCFAHVRWTFSFPTNNSRMPWPTFLKLCPHNRPEQQRSPIETGFKVKMTGDKYAKNISDCLINNFPKWISSSYFVQLILNWFMQFYKTSVTKKSLGGIMFYRHLLLFFWMIAWRNRSKYLSFESMEIKLHLSNYYEWEDVSRLPIKKTKFSLARFPQKFPEEPIKLPSLMYSWLLRVSLLNRPIV